MRRGLFSSCLLFMCSTLGGCFNPEQTPGSGSASLDGTGTDTSESETDPSATTTSPSTTSATSSNTTASTDTPVDTSDSDDPSMTTVDPDSTDGSTGTPVACSGVDGELDGDCPSEQPFCQGNTCVDCGDLADGAGACAGIDAATPVCSGGACVACTEHDECGSGACRRDTGECFPDDNRLWVDNTAPNCANGSGAEDSPMCAVTTAMSVIDGQPGTEPWAIFVAGSPSPYVGTIDPNSGRALAVIGPSAGLAATLDGNMDYALDLWAQSPETYVAHVTLTTSSGSSTIRGGGQCALDLSDVALIDGGEAIVTNGCNVLARRSLIQDNYNTNVIVSSGGQLTTEDVVISNASAGMLVEGTARLHRTHVFGHYVGGGIEIAGGSLLMVNSIVHNNQYVNDGIHSNGGSLELLYTTVVGAVTCSNGATATIRNSIVLNHVSEAGQACAAADVDNSVVNQGLAQGAGNVMAGPDDLPQIFVDLGFNGDYHTLAGSIPAGVAVWQDGDPVVDFDGDERPGDEDYAGADIP